MGQHPDWSQVPADAFRLFLCHTPDHIQWARSQQVDLMLSGHNHGGQVVLPVLGPVYSPSIYGTRYASGVFWEEPTLLYVSRGISGRHPLRWRCPPELTKLVLTSK
jgi:predicted MPP superfamily phosphohydrolase